MTAPPHVFGGNPVGLRCEDAGSLIKTLEDDERAAVLAMIGDPRFTYSAPTPTAPHLKSHAKFVFRADRVQRAEKCGASGSAVFRGF